MDSINNLLSKLRDIHLPNDLPWWPLAPGWYVVIAAAFILGLIITTLIIKRWLRKRAKRQALSELDFILSDYRVSRDATQLVSQVGILLKRVALVYFPRYEVAMLHGDEWVNFLSEHVKELDFKEVRTLLVSGPYQKHTDGDVEQLITITKKWIKRC